MAGAALAVGAILLRTGAVGFCPRFMLVGISTYSSGAGAKK
ncbi:MAG: DUF2892 domain-containing protein [Nitrospira sp.]|nr:DUF2892 domain-containing protein [Nitrospira sp.]